MASVEEEACPILKTTNMDPSTSIHSVQSINGSFPKIDNLEYFPEKVLHHIFSKLDDAGLLNVAIKSYRFEGIAKIVFKENYAKKYFVFDSDTDSSREMYEELFSRFGRYADIKAIKAKGIQNIDNEHHWLPKLLRQYTSELDKLAFDECTFTSVRDILQQHMNITHLSVRGVNHLNNLPDYRNLVKLELISCRQVYSLAQTVQQNPALESLILYNSGHFYNIELLMVIAEHSKNLKELNLKSSSTFNTLQIPADRMDVVVESLKQLELFGLHMSYRDDGLELVQRLSLECKHLKQLDVSCSAFAGNVCDGIFEAIRRFETLERLTIEKWKYDSRIESLVESLPSISHLRLSMEIPSPDTSILSLLRKCPSLEEITINYSPFTDVPKYFLNLNFFNQFNGILQQPHAKIELEEDGRKVGAFVTGGGIVWRNMLLHWIECDPSYNLSGINLLDLAKPMDAPNAERRNPFEHILDHLDLRSLSSLSTASKCSNQLVQGYAKRHAQRNGTFTITDDFRYDLHGLGAFADHVRSLKVYFLNSGFGKWLRLIRVRYQNLNKLWICTNRCLPANSCVFPQVRQMILNVPMHTGGPQFDFYEFSRLNPDLEAVEFKEPVKFEEMYDKKGVLQFRNLKKFVFNYKDEVDRNYAISMFRNTTTKLIPIKKTED